MKIKPLLVAGVIAALSFISAPANASLSVQSAGSASIVLPNATISQQNAIAKAKSYLSWSAFSRTGLIGQLEYEGFSRKDAKYAVDSLKVNWNLQAKKKAKSYLSSSAFSKIGLIDQLEYEGFTSAQANFGVNKIKVNWNLQAAKKAKSYLRSGSFSRQGLIDQLLYEGFTEAQAIYGVNQTGL